MAPDLGATIDAALPQSQEPGIYRRMLLILHRASQSPIDLLVMASSSHNSNQMALALGAYFGAIA